MSTFAIIMLGTTAFFAYQIYRHIQTLKDKKEESTEAVFVPIEPKSVDASAALIEEADEAYGEGDLERALEKLNRADKLSKDNPEIINKRAFINGKLGNVDKAIELYRASLAIDDTDDLTHNAIASMYKEQGGFEQAQEHYEKALKIDDEYAVTYYNYGNLFNEMGEKEKAQEMYTQALMLQEEFPQAREALEKLKENA